MQVEPLAAAAEPLVETPLGVVRLHASAEYEIHSQFWQAYGVGSSCTLFKVEGDHASIEVLRCPFKGELPPGMTVQGSWALICRIRANHPLKKIRIGVEWTAEHSWTQGGPEPGEGLEAETWSDGRTKVSVGTEHGELLASRAIRGEWMPHRLAQDLSAGNIGLIEYTDTGLMVPLPSLEPGELCQVHFVIAWAPDVIDDVSTWYAVDVPSDRVLGNSECD